MKKKNIGSSLDGLLREEGLYESVNAAAMSPATSKPLSRNRDLTDPGPAQSEGRPLSKFL
jgi:hypothetical protein